MTYQCKECNCIYHYQGKQYPAFCPACGNYEGQVQLYHQCPECERVKDIHCNYIEKPKGFDRNSASHQYCPECAAVWMKSLDQEGESKEMSQETPNTPKNIDWAVEAFAEAMKAVLQEPRNMQKLHWSECKESFLEEKLEGHAVELRCEISRIEDAEDYERTCIHVANFAMMLWQNSVYLRMKGDDEDAVSPEKARATEESPQGNQ